MITAWSPSRLRDYEECPRKAKYKYIDKLKEEEGPAMARGTAIHNNLDMLVTGRGGVWDDDTKLVKKTVKQLATEYKKKRVKVSLKWAFNKDWKPTGYFDKDVWVRLTADVLWLKRPDETLVIDWKTGGKQEASGEMALKPEYEDQLDIYAVGALSMGMGERVRGELIFTDHGKSIGGFLTRLDELPERKKKWAKRALPMFKDKKFAPRPGLYCKWCSFSQNKNGPCEY